VGFLVGLNRGVPTGYSVAKRLVISSEYSPDDQKPESGMHDLVAVKKTLGGGDDEVWRHQDASAGTPVIKGKFDGDFANGFFLVSCA
jgi:hypothetical protein